jgi:cysteine desulfurase/selenocysteine lyase
MALQTRDTTGIEVDKIRQGFSTLRLSIHGKPVLCLGNAASILKLRSVFDCHRYIYEFEYANTNEENSLSRNATRAVEDVRSSIAIVLTASSPETIVLLRDATEAVKLIAYAFERSQLQPGDEAAVRDMEHDATFFRGRSPDERSGAKLRTAPVEISGELDLNGPLTSAPVCRHCPAV